MHRRRCLQLFAGAAVATRGAIGTGALGWRSKFTEADMRISHFKWLPERGDAIIDRLEPFAVIAQSAPPERST